MKKHFIKIVSTLVLLVFVGLLSFSFTPYMESVQNHHHNNDMQCFGAGCGPVEHMVMHSYTLAALSIQIKTSYNPQFLSPEKDKIYNSLSSKPDSPPPKNSLT